ncbi:hypothetical protein [Bacillus pinisoli]|uniref:hypothetical protein n=1 Tax=Bacillus pinisoli TaxID=2901866 RepID=UPI001FF63E65|nr:hypothetical protein [Bacillus pinisoli]
MKLSEIEAYKAMMKFLEKHYERTQSDDFGDFLSGLLLLEDGSSADPAALEEWYECIKEVNKAN